MAFILNLNLAVCAVSHPASEYSGTIFCDIHWDGSSNGTSRWHCYLGDRTYTEPIGMQRY
ncbi:MAG: hypothetical protein SAJ12_24005 [Jaaginema sp. PMC 1079.18]|nr:hypothetical protein [Jaaginema sp. PMC 1080.18]MEC4854059.1 hypothetical protein [Jaaginema sp. PMC 1079.18]MEC4867798.1 hypothetical protein [Jaaginema sp. PMC 1078.18]